MQNKKVGSVYGYVRVSSADQNEDRQLVLRVSLNAEETVTVFPALFFYPKAGGRRLKH